MTENQIESGPKTTPINRSIRRAYNPTIYVRYQKNSPPGKLKNQFLTAKVKAKSSFCFPFSVLTVTYS